MPQALEMTENCTASNLRANKRVSKKTGYSRKLARNKGGIELDQEWIFREGCTSGIDQYNGSRNYGEKRILAKSAEERQTHV